MDIATLAYPSYSWDLNEANQKSLNQIQAMLEPSPALKEMYKSLNRQSEQLKAMFEPSPATKQFYESFRKYDGQMHAVFGPYTEMAKICGRVQHDIDRTTKGLSFQTPAINKLSNARH